MTQETTLHSGEKGARAEWKQKSVCSGVRGMHVYKMSNEGIKMRGIRGEINKLRGMMERGMCEGGGKWTER